MADDKPNITRMDRRTLRALSHPLRLRLLGMLREDGAATASGLAQRVGESSGTTSWHLRQLAEAGMVEEDATRGNKRERWWRAVHEAHELRTTDFLGDPELAGPLNVYLQSVVEQRYAAESQFVADRALWQQEWAEASELDDFPLSLTPSEAMALNEEVRAVVERYRRQPQEGDTPVRAHWAAFPRRPHPEQDRDDRP